MGGCGILKAGELNGLLNFMTVLIHLCFALYFQWIWEKRRKIRETGEWTTRVPICSTRTLFIHDTTTYDGPNLLFLFQLQAKFMLNASDVVSWFKRKRTRAELGKFGSESSSSWDVFVSFSLNLILWSVPPTKEVEVRDLIRISY